MSYVLLDDGFPDHPKLLALSDAAFRAHVRAMCWAKRQRTGGKIPRGALAQLTLGKRSVVKELEREKLWEVTPDGWAIHDWEAWYNEGPEVAEEVKRELDQKRIEASRARSEAARTAGRASAEARRSKLGSAQPVRTVPNESFDDAPNERSSGARTEPRTSPNGDAERSPEPSRTSSRARTDARPPSPSPDQRDPTGEVAAKDQAGSARAAPPEAAAAREPAQEPEPDAKLPCPQDLALLPMQLTNLALVKGVSGQAVAELTFEYVGSYLGKPNERRTLDAWRAGLWTKVSTEGPERTLKLKRQTAESDDEARRRAAESRARADAAFANAPPRIPLKASAPTDDPEAVAEAKAAVAAALRGANRA